MRSQHRPEHVRRRLDIRDPVAHRLVDRVLQRPRARLDTVHRRAKHTHAKHVERLARDVFRAHVHDAFDAEQRTRRRGRHTVLPRARLRHHATLAHARSQQHLAERVVDLVRAGVREVLTLEEQPHRRARRRPTRLVQRRRSAHVVRQQPLQFREKLRILPSRQVRGRQFVDRLDERLGDVPSAECAEIPARIRVPPSEHRARHH